MVAVAAVLPEQSDHVEAAVAAPQVKQDQGEAAAVVAVEAHVPAVLQAAAVAEAPGREAAAVPPAPDPHPEEAETGATIRQCCIMS